MTLLIFLRSFRVGPFAVFDFAISYLLVYLLAPWLQKKGLRLNRAQQLWLTLPVSVLVHIAFGSMTPLTKMALDPSGSYAVKALLVFMVYMAYRASHGAKVPTK